MLRYYHLHKFSLEYDWLLQDAIEQNSIQEKASGKRDRTKRGKIRTLADRLIAHKREVSGLELLNSYEYFIYLFAIANSL